jgi:hypothetical protein
LAPSFPFLGALSIAVCHSLLKGARVPTTYTFRPRPIGSPIVLSLQERTLTITTGLTSREVALSRIGSVRLVYEPKGLAQRTFATKFSVMGGKRYRFSSGSWSGLAEVRSQGTEYIAFQKAFLAGVAKHNPQARFTAGQPLVIWGLTAIALAASAVVFTTFLLQVLKAGNWLGLLAGGAFAAVGIWQILPMFARNRPRSLDPGNPPADLLPPPAAR